MRRRAAVALLLGVGLAGCGVGAGAREDRYQNVAVTGRETNSAYVVNVPKSFDNVAMKCIPAAGGGVILIATARSSGGLALLPLAECPPDVATAQAG